MFRVKSDALIKIWFSVPGYDSLGGVLNEARLLRHRSLFPNDDIVLVSNFENFDPQKYARLQKFCARTDVNVSLLSLLEIETEIKDSTVGDKEVQLALLKIARNEIEQEVGCLAAASDIVRILTPFVRRKRLYSDFDSRKIAKYKDGKRLRNPEILDAPFGFLVSGDPMLSVEGVPSFENISNDVLVCDESKTNFLVHYRALMHRAYFEKSQLFMLALIKEMQAEGTITKEEVRNVIQFVIDNKSKFGELSPVFQYRSAMKHCLDPEAFDVFLTKQVVGGTGPDCLKAALEEIIPVEFPQNCRRRNLPQREWGEELSLLSVEHRSIKQLGYQLFMNEDDTSWLRSDSRKAKVEVLKSSADTIGNFYLSLKKMRSAKAEQCELRSEKKVSMNTLKS